MLCTELGNLFFSIYGSENLDYEISGLEIFRTLGPLAAGEGFEPPDELPRLRSIEKGKTADGQIDGSLNDRPSHRA